MLKILLIACKFLFRHLKTLPKLYYYCSSRRDIRIHDLRKFEKICLKVTKLRLDILFFERCFGLKICPKFLRFKPPRLKAYRRTENIKLEVIKNQIGFLRKELQTTCQRYTHMKTKLQSKLSMLEYAVLMSKLNKKCRDDSAETEKRHLKKLTNLWREERAPAPDCLINRSDRKLSLEEENVLRLLLKHHVLPKNLDGIQIKTRVEQLWDFAKRTIVNGIDSSTESMVKDEVRHSTHSFLKSANNVCETRINRKFHETLKSLKKDPTIKVCSFDKGNGTVIVNASEYFDKLDKIVFDKSKFQEVPVSPNLAHPVIRNENSVKSYLRKNVKEYISKDDFDFIQTSGSQPGKLYGLCKAHKPDFPFRPVVSMINTTEYNLAKYLDKIIKPHINSDYMLSSTSNFLDKIKAFCFKSDDILISFGIVSLFTTYHCRKRKIS